MDKGITLFRAQKAPPVSLGTNSSVHGLYQAPRHPFRPCASFSLSLVAFGHNLGGRVLASHGGWQSSSLCLDAHLLL